VQNKKRKGTNDQFPFHSNYKKRVITFIHPKKESHNGMLIKTAQHIPIKKFPSSLFKALALLITIIHQYYKTFEYKTLSE